MPLLIFSLLLLGATVIITLSYIKQNRSLVDFYLARRGVGWTMNGSAISVSRFSVLIVGMVFLILGLMFEGKSLIHLLNLAVTVAASSVAPVLLLGIWWMGITERASGAGLMAGLMASINFAFAHPPGLDIPIPALLTMLAGFLTIFLVSKTDQGRVPKQVNEFMARVHSNSNGHGQQF